MDSQSNLNKTTLHDLQEDLDLGLKRTLKFKVKLYFAWFFSVIRYTSVINGQTVLTTEIHLCKVKLLNSAETVRTLFVMDRFDQNNPDHYDKTEISISPRMALTFLLLWPSMLKYFARARCFAVALISGLLVGHLWY